MKVRFTRTAQRDLAQIHAYISQDSSTIASRFVAQLMEQRGELVITHSLVERPTNQMFELSSRRACGT